MRPTKHCSKCNLEKPLEEFSNCARGKYGKKSYCKECDRIHNQDLYNKNKNKRILQNQIWQIKNREEYLEYQRTYHQNKSKPEPPQ